MAQRKAAKKDLRQNKTRRQRNLLTAQKIKSALKKFKKALESKDITLSQQSLNEVYKILDKAATKKLIHSNKAARKKSRLSKLLKKSVSQSSK
jgi:small subunit ribosomal protein S20